jgi:hypothetical protein
MAGWRNGRRTGLKILFPVREVRVRPPPRLLISQGPSAVRGIICSKRDERALLMTYPD